MFSFAQLTDPHIIGKQGTIEQLDATVDRYYRHVVRDVGAEGVDFIVNTGDLCSGGVPSFLHERVKHHIDRLAEQTGIPYYVVKGGHDHGMNRDKTTSFSEFERIYGKSMYWFEHKGWAFLVLDRWQQFYRRMPMVWEDMSPEAMDVVRKMLAEIPDGMPIVAFMHENPVGATGMLSGHMLLHILKQHPVKLLLFGHVHSNYISTYEGIAHACIVGEGSSFDSAPLTYNLVTCHDDGTVTCDFKPVRTLLPKAEPVEVAISADRQVSFGDDVSTLRGPSGTRCFEAELPDVAPSCVWKQALAGRMSVGAPKLVDGTLYVTTQSRGRVEQCTVNALDARTGTVRWTTPVDGDVPGGLLVHHGNGYCGTSAGSMYCVSLDDGSVRWKWNNRENLPIGCEPAMDEDGLLHFGANWEAYAVDAATGRTVWRVLAAPHGAISYFSPGGSSPLPYGDRVYHQRNFNGGPAGFSSLAQAMDRKTGLNLQHSKAENFPGQRHASPILWNGRLVTAGECIYVYDPQNLEDPKVHVKLGDSAATPAVDGSTAYVSGMRQITACELETGEKLWEIEHEKALLYFRAPVKTKAGDSGWGNFSAPLVADNGLVVCDTGGNIRQLSKETGDEVWRVNLGSPILSAPTISGNALFACDYEGNVYAFAW